MLGPGSLSCEEFERQAKAMAEASKRCGQVIVFSSFHSKMFKRCIVFMEADAMKKTLH